MGTIDAASALLAAARWLLSAAAMLVIGHLGAHLVCRRQPAIAVRAGELTVAARLARSLIHSTCLLVAACGALLAAQAYTWFGATALSEGSQLWVAVTDSRWGQHWQEATAAALASAVLAAAARRWEAIRTVALVLTAGFVAATTPLIGHGGAHGSLNWLNHAVHLAGAGLWIGTLTVLLFRVWPVLSASDHPGARTRALLSRFTPIALAAAACVIVTGLVTANLHVQPTSALVTTDYGRTLALKMIAVGMVTTIGYRNWRTHRSPLADDVACGSLRRRAVFEARLALLVVVGLTAWLSGLAIPAVF